jgi:hypothetical protein
MNVLCVISSHRAHCLLREPAPLLDISVIKYNEKKTPLEIAAKKKTQILSMLSVQNTANHLILKE